MVEVGVRVLGGTAQPWVWSSWTGWWRRELRDRYQRRRARIRLHDVADLSAPDWRLRKPEPLSPADITAHTAFYTPEQIRHIINFPKWNAAGVGSGGAGPTPPSSWSRDLGRSWRPWPDVTHIKLEARPPGPGGGGGGVGVVSRGSTGWWEGAGRGLPLGAALLAAILLLLRVADRCLHTNLFKLPIRRRQSEEWPTPNVMATSLRMTSDINSMRPPSPLAECTEQGDLPPPYSECADGTPACPPRQKPEHEEPPPPYSACYVAYSNPKDGPPSVHFFTRQCQNLFANFEAGPSSLDTGQTTPENQDSISDEGVGRVDFEDSTELEVRGVFYEGQSENILNDDAHAVNSDNDAEEAKNATSVTRDSYLVV